MYLLERVVGQFLTWVANEQDPQFLKTFDPPLFDHLVKPKATSRDESAPALQAKDKKRSTKKERSSAGELHYNIGHLRSFFFDRDGALLLPPQLKQGFRNSQARMTEFATRLRDLNVERNNIMHGRMLKGTDDAMLADLAFVLGGINDWVTVGQGTAERRATIQAREIFNGFRICRLAEGELKDLVKSGRLMPKRIPGGQFHRRWDPDRKAFLFVSIESPSAFGGTWKDDRFRIRRKAEAWPEFSELKKLRREPAVTVTESGVSLIPVNPDPVLGIPFWQIQKSRESRRVEIRPPGEKDS